MIGRQPFSPFKARQRALVSKEVEVAHTRLLIVASLALSCFILVAARLIDVTVLATTNPKDTKHFIGKADYNLGRGNIYDRNGWLLATSLDSFSLYANPKIISDTENTISRLIKILPELDAKELRERFDQKQGFFWIKRQLTPQQKYAINRLGIPGLDFKTEKKRLYPAGSLTSHVVGFTDIDNRGLAGIERKFDAQLSSPAAPPKHLSIDIRVQHVMQTALAKAVQKFNAIGGAGLVMNAMTGEVISMVSLPEFNPNDVSAEDGKARFNKATLGVYEMGSTFKIFTAAMALDSGKISMRSGYDATHPIRMGRFLIRDYHAKKRWLSVPEIFIYSSNIGSVKMAMDVGGNTQRAFLKKLGLLNKSPLELEEISAPIVPQRWRDVNTMTIAFGHGMAVSPIQITSAVAAMVNGGTFHAPTLIRKSGAPSGRRVISTKTSDEIRRLLRLVVSQGTGSKAEAHGYLVGGKTGTAEKVVGNRYKQKALMSSFVAAFPMNSPRYVVFVMVDEPIGNKESQGYATGGWVAAPVVSEVIKRIGPLLGVQPVNYSDPSVRNDLAINVLTIKSGKKSLASF
jgi:cell division protein FtsI (penicillin-binding protein 3)